MGEFNLINFGEAIEALKDGKFISRKGWNGKGMYLYLNSGLITEDMVPEVDNTFEGIREDLFTRVKNNVSTILPNINMKTATGSIVTGWLASQTDMLAEDWLIL